MQTLIYNRIEAKKAAGGLPHSIWEKQKGITPTLTEELSPERITLYLPIGGSKITSRHKEVIIEYLTAHVSASAAEIGTILELKSSRVRELLSDLLKQRYIVSEGSNRNRIFQLKA